jgi:AcrR family transcriptional regulator
MAEALRTHPHDENLIRGRRNQIFQAACRVLGRKSFHEASVKEIALEAGLSAGSIYLYLDGKDEIIPLIAESMVAEFIDRVPAIEAASGGDPRVHLIGIMRAIIDVIDRYREAFAVLNHEGRYLERRPQYRVVMRRIREDYMGKLSDVIERGIVSGAIRSENPRMAAHAIHMLCAGWANGPAFMKNADKDAYWREISRMVEGQFFPDAARAGGA